jgi:hypothetical protein
MRYRTIVVAATLVAAACSSNDKVKDAGVDARVDTRVESGAPDRTIDSRKTGCQSDADCASAPGKLCDTATGRCVACRSGAECSYFSTEKPTCDAVLGTCRACAAQVDCADNPRGPVCAVAPDQPGCTCKSDGDCKGAYAYGSKCGEPAGVVRCMCESNADCAGNAHGPTCLTGMLGLCTCTTDADCTKPPYTKCYRHASSPDVLHCQKPCTSSADCATLGGQIDACVSGKCVQCQADKDCELGPGAPARYCVQGRCGDCRTSADCSTDLWMPVCNPIAGACGECQSNSDCSASPLGGVCTAKPNFIHYCGCATAKDCAAAGALGSACIDAKQCGCSTDADCVGNPRGPSCDLASHECSCTGDSQCTAPLSKCYYRLSVKQCQKPCALDTDCFVQGAPTGKCIGGKCGGCTNDADCSPGKCGTSGICVDCKLDSDCPGGFCNAAAGRCITCKTDANCPTVGDPDAKVCNLATGQCVVCVTSADCSKTALGMCGALSNLCPVCSALSSGCVECLTDADCTGAALGNTCNNGQCQCATNGDCASNPNGHFCAFPKGSQRCSCQSNADCPPGKTCSQNPLLPDKVCTQ